MPIDPSVIHVQPIQQPDLLGTAAQVLQLRNAQQSGEFNKLKLQEARDDYADQQTVKQAYAATHGDLDAALPMLAGKVSSHTYMGLTNAWMEQQKQRLALAEQQGKLAEQLHESMAKAATGVKAAGNTPEAFIATAQRWAQFIPQVGQMLAPYVEKAQQDPSIIPQLMDQFIAGSKTGQAEMTAVGAQQRGQAAANADQRAAQMFPDVQAKAAAEAQKAKDEAAGKAPIQPYQAAQLGNSAAQLDLSKQRESREAKQGAAQLGISREKLAMEKERNGFDMSGGVSEAAQMAVDGRMSPQTLRMILRKNPGFISQIRQVDPNFDEVNIENRYQTLKEFTNTQANHAGGQLLALNTLVHHADLYMEAAQALKNGTFRPGNEIYNKVATAFGAAPPVQADLVARFFASETGKVATGGVPAEGEINGLLKSLNNNSSPEQMFKVGQTMLQLAAGRATPLSERLKEAHLQDVKKVFGPDAQAILQRRGLDPNTMKPVQAAAAPKKGDKRTYQGHEYTFDGSQWVR